ILARSRATIIITRWRSIGTMTIARLIARSAAIARSPIIARSAIISGASVVSRSTIIGSEIVSRCGAAFPRRRSAFARPWRPISIARPFGQRANSQHRGYDEHGAHGKTCPFALAHLLLLCDHKVPTNFLARWPNYTGVNLKPL